MLTDTGAASILTRVERHLRPAKRPPPPLPGALLRRHVVYAGYKQAEVAPAARFPQPLAVITDAIAEPEPYGTVNEQDDMAEVRAGLN